MPDQQQPEVQPQSSGPPAPVPQSSIAAELSRQYDAAEAKEKPEPEAKSGTPVPITGGQGNVTPEGPKRDESGRFASDKKPEAKAEPKPDAKAKDDKDPKAAADAGVKPAEAAQEPKEKIAPHPRWKQEVQERFSKLADADPDLAKFVLERQTVAEKEFHSARQASAHAEKYRTLEDVLAPGRQARSMQGVDDPTFLRSLVAASDYLAKDPKGGIKMLAEQYGVDLKEVAEGGDASPENHPAVKALQQRVQELEGYIRQVNDGAHQQRVQGVFQHIQSFAQAKNEAGELLYPHFRDVIDDITTVVARQVEAGQQPDLKAAYEKAIRLNDPVWMKIQAAKSEAERKQREEEEAHRIAEAKRAGFSVSGSGGAGDSVGGSIRDELRRQIEKHFR